MTIVRRNDGGSAQQGDGVVREAIPVFDINMSSGGGATSTVKLEDGAHTTGDAGTFILAVRNDANTSLTDTTGDYSPIAVDAAGRIKLSGTDTTVTPAAVTLVAATSNTLLAANTARVRFRIINPLATTLYVRLAASAATAVAGGYDIIVPSGTEYVSDPYEYLGQIRGICATAGDVGISESV